MTDLLEPVAAIAEARRVPRRRRVDPHVDLADGLRLVLASLAAAAGAIHFAMAPSHMGESTVEGVGFVVTGWLQLGMATLLLRRPRRPILQGTLVLSAVFVGVWAVSRTSGLPFGEHAGHPESVTWVDGVCVALEVLLAGIVAAVLVRPRLAIGGVRRPVLRSRHVAPAFAVLVAAITSVVLLSPSARDHAAHAHGDHGVTTVAAGSEGHVHGASAVDDKGLSLLHNGHHAAIATYDLDPASQRALDAQLDITRSVARQYPTVADAEAGGYHRTGPYFPGIGAHYIKFGASELNADGIMSDDDLHHPLALIYDGESPRSQITGFMYYSSSPVEPQGFVGRNDVWHYHQRLCFKRSAEGVDIPFGLDSDSSATQCAAVGGFLLKRTQWMVHVWTVPGWDHVDGGVFAEVNPGLDCPDGTYYMRPPAQWKDHLRNVCKSAS